MKRISRSSLPLYALRPALRSCRLNLSYGQWCWEVLTWGARLIISVQGPYLVAQQRAEKLRNIIAPEMSHPLAQLGAILASKRGMDSFDTYSAYEKPPPRGAVLTGAWADDARIVLLEAASTGDVEATEQAVRVLWTLCWSLRARR